MRLIIPAVADPKTSYIVGIGDEDGIDVDSSEHIVLKHRASYYVLCALSLTTRSSYALAMDNTSRFLVISPSLLSLSSHSEQQMIVDNEPRTE